MNVLLDLFFMLLGWAEAHPYLALALVFIVFFIGLNKTIYDNSTRSYRR